MPTLTRRSFWLALTVALGLVFVTLAASAFTPFGQRVAAQILPLRSLAAWGAKAVTVPFPSVPPPCPSVLTVNNLGDAGDANPGDEVCETAAGNGICTLRAAIQEANALPSCTPLTINFSVNGTITLGSQLPTATTGTRTITGNGAASTIIQANANENVAAYRIFRVSTSSGNWTLENLTIRHGGNDTASLDGGGVGVDSGATLTIKGSIIEKCRGRFGGAVSALSATLNVISSTIRDSRASRDGAGIDTQTSSVTITNSTITNNTNANPSSNGAGGGITALDDSSFTMSGSTVSNNTHTSTLGGSGGGLYFSGFSGGSGYITNSLIIGNSTSPNASSTNGGGVYIGGSDPLIITNTTFTNNTASNKGGAIYHAASGTLTLTNVTISDNTAANSGGVYKSTSNGTLNLNNTLLANNTGGDCNRQTVGGPVNGQHSLIENTVGGGNSITGTDINNLTGDPMLAPLGNYGGPTLTFALLSGSPALNAGSNALAVDANNQPLTTDQRGTGFPRQIGSAVDIGAFELDYEQSGASLIVNSTDNTDDGTCTAGNCTLREAINLANEDPAPTTINLMCGTYSYSTPHNWEFGPNALPIIQSNITIQGNGAVLTSTATTRLRFFYVAGNNVGGLATGTLTLQDLTLQNGKQKGGDSKGNGGGSGMGGAIFNHGAVTLERVTLQSNTATGGSSINAPLTFQDQGGGGIGEDGRPTQNQGGGFGGTPIGTGGTGGTSFGSQRGGGGGGFRPGDNGGNATFSAPGAGGGAGLLGGKGGGFGSDGGAPGDGGGGGGQDTLPGSNGPGGAYGFGGIGGGVAGGGGGGVGGGGGGGIGGGGGFGGGGLGNSGTARGGGGGFGGGGGRGAGPGGFAGGNGGACCNTFGGGGGGGLGGAIFNHLGTLTLINTTLTGNTAQGGNGSSSTQVDNGGGGSGGSGFGGAIFNLNGTVTVTSSTLAGNTVTAGAAGTGVQNGSPGSADGGAIYNLAYGNTFTGGATTATVTISNSILATTSGGTNDLVNDKRDGSQTNTATVIFNNGNLVMARTALNSATTTINGSTPLTANPNLGALAVLSNCAASTCKPAVLPLLTGSPAINAATVDVNVTTDQTGTSRGTSPDLGAYENCCMLAKDNWPASLPGGTVGTAYTMQTFAVTGNSGTVNWSVTNGSLPNGLMLSSATGTSISLGGTPTASGMFSFTLNATDSLGCVVSQMYAINIGCPSFTVGTPTASGTINLNYSGSVAASPAAPAGLAYSYSLANSTTLPVGLMLNASTGAITGIPTTVGNVSFDIKAELVTSPGNVSTGCAVTVQRSINITCVVDPVVQNNNDSGTGSLREAIAIACPGSTITFANGISLITLTSGELVINKNLTIQGPGASLLTVQRSTALNTPAFRVFNAQSGTVLISGLTITNGGGNVFAAGIMTATDLTLDGCVVTGNHAVNAFAGGIGWIGGALTIRNSAITANRADNGGAIYGNGTSFSMSNSTVSGNTSVFQVAGLWINPSVASSLTNVTISNNTTGTFPNALLNIGVAVTLTNCTVANNSGAVGLTGLIQLRNTIVANNGTTNFSGPITSLGHNLSTGSDAAVLNQASDLNNTNPLLAPLGNYGGPTQTHRPLPGSPVINAGNNCVLTANGCGNNNPALATDQRGTGFPRQVGSNVDIGAVEVNYALAATSGTPQSTTINTTFANPLVATLTESNLPVSNVLLTFTAPGSGPSTTFPNGNTATTNASGQVSVNVAANTISGGPYTVTANTTPGLATAASFSLTNTCLMPTVSNPTDQNVLQGGTATFSVTPGGTPAPTVKWQVSTDGGSNYTDIPLATGNLLTLNNVTAAMNGHRYRAIAESTCGSATSKSALLVVHAAGAKFDDPLVCLVGGDTGIITAFITNNGAAPVNASYSATNLAPNLIGIPGSGVASVAPANFVITPTTANWNGVLQPGETVNLLFRVQFAPGLLNGAQVCFDATFVIDGNQTMQPICTILNCPVGGINPAVSAQKPGSLLVFPYYTSKAATKADTRFTLTNLGTQMAYVHLFFIDGATCQPADQFLCLTPGASYSGKASETDGETTGWILALAVNQQGTPIQYNNLIGNAFVNDGDYVDNYGAEAFVARSPNVAAIQGATALLFFDGVGYDAMPNQFAVEVQSPLNAANQRVVTVGLRGDLNASALTGAAQIGTGLVINGNETPMGSFINWLTGNCQAIATVTNQSPRVPLGMNGVIPNGQHGTMQFRIGGGVGLLMTPKTAPFAGIRALHKTGLTTSTLRIPLLPPVC